MDYWTAMARYHRRLRSLKHTALCRTDAEFYFRLGTLEELRNYICEELRREDWDTSILKTPFIKRLINRRNTLCQNPS